MKYLTTYIRRRGESGDSLLLQEYSCRGVPACFACLCSCGGRGKEEREAGRAVMEALLDWNRKFPWHKAVKAPLIWLARGECGLTEKLRPVCAGQNEVKWRLFVCVDQEFLTLGNGWELSLLSASFGKGSAVRMRGSFRGCLEPGAGILLAEEGFLEDTNPRALEQIVRAWEMERAEQAAGRLRELARNGQTAGTGERTAVLLIAKEGEDA